MKFVSVLILAFSISLGGCSKGLPSQETHLPQRADTNTFIYINNSQVSGLDQIAFAPTQTQESKPTQETKIHNEDKSYWWKIVLIIIASLGVVYFLWRYLPKRTKGSEK